MNFFFLALLVFMLVAFGYAQLQKGVVKTPGQINLHEKEEVEIR